MVVLFDLDAPPVSPNAADDEFDSTTLDPKWTVVNGTVGTVALTATGGGVYDLTSRPGWLLMQSDIADNYVQLRQDYTLGDGESVVVAVATGITASGSSGIADGHIGCGITLNTDDEPPNRVTINIDSETEGWRVYSDRHIGGVEDAQHTIPAANTSFAAVIARRLYLRVLRDGLDYYCMWSVDGAAWFQFAKKTMPAAMTSFTIFAESDSSPDPTSICAFDWVRIGGSDIDPWDAMVEYGAATAATRLAIGPELRIQPHVTHKAAIRFELGASAVAQARPVHRAALRLAMGFAGQQDVGPSDGTAQAAMGAGLTLRLQPRVTHRVGLRLDMGLSALISHDQAPASPAIRSALGMELRLSAHVTHRAALRLEYGLVQAAVTKAQYRSRLRLTLGMGVRDAYVGPGTGVVATGERFSVNALREGDTFSVFLPWGGLEGVTGLAHVMSRTARDDRAEQEVELAIVENDARNVPRQRGGATPQPTVDGTDVARRQARQGREIDKLERNRNG